MSTIFSKEYNGAIFKYHAQLSGVSLHRFLPAFCQLSSPLTDVSIINVLVMNTDYSSHPHLQLLFVPQGHLILAYAFLRHTCIHITKAPRPHPFKVSSSIRVVTRNPTSTTKIQRCFLFSTFSIFPSHLQTEQ